MYCVNLVSASHLECSEKLLVLLRPYLNLIFTFSCFILFSPLKPIFSHKYTLNTFQKAEGRK